MANHLAKLLKGSESGLKTVISTHRPLFFNVLCNELNRANKYFLSRDGSPEGLLLRKTRDTPFFQHVAAIAELYEVERDGRLYNYHFNMLRAILETTASFHGYQNFSACIKHDADDEDGTLHTVDQYPQPREIFVVRTAGDAGGEQTLVSGDPPRIHQPIPLQSRLVPE